MEHELPGLYRAAIKAATPSIGRIAAEQDVHYQTVGMYYRGLRSVSRPAVQRLVVWLREHAARLLDYAEQLDRALLQETHRPTRRVGPRRKRG